MATSAAILMTMIKFSEPKDLSKPTTGYSPVDADTQDAVARYKRIQGLSRREPGIQRMLGQVRDFANMSPNQIAAQPGLPRRSSPPSMEYRKATGEEGFRAPSDFFQDLGRFAGFAPSSGGAINDMPLREAARQYPMESTLGAADVALSGIQSGLGRDNVNRRMAGQAALMNNYMNAVGADVPVSRTFFDRKNQLRNY
jgi:hypothetical protein